MSPLKPLTKEQLLPPDHQRKEQRSGSRHRTLKKGEIVFGKGSRVIECLVRNLSDTGARLEVEAWFECPDRVTLRIIGGPSYECRVVHHKETELGVTFLIEDHRAGPRFGSRRDGTIAFNEGKSMIDCKIKNLSDRGARLEVKAGIECPDRITLHLTDGPTYECRVVRHAETEWGVTFLGED